MDPERLSELSQRFPTQPAVFLESTAHDPAQRPVQRLVFDARFDQGLPRFETLNLGDDGRHVLDIREAKIARRHIEEGDPPPPRIAADAHQVVGTLMRQGRGIEDHARAHDADDLALHESLGLPGILHLLGDGYPMTLRDQLLDVGGTCVMGYASHGNRIRRMLVPRGEREVELPRRQHGIVEEHLVEVAHPEEEDRVGIGLLELVILLEHRRAHRRTMTAA